MNNTLVKGLGLLEILARSDGPRGVTELANELGINKSNVHRLLQALVELGYVRQDPDQSTYAATIRIWELGVAVLQNLDLRRIAEPVMQWLLARSRETVHLSLLEGDEVVYVHKLDSPEPVRAYSEIGGRAPAHCVATGKAMLAWRGQAQLEVYARQLRAYTPRTITRPAEFLLEMDRIRRSGFALNRGEWRESVGGVAAPIRDPSGGVIAAIGVSGPIERMKRSAQKVFAADVCEAASRLTAELAGRSSSAAGGPATLAEGRWLAPEQPLTLVRRDRPRARHA